MEAYQDLLLDVWREACRHIQIDHSTQTIARLLGGRMPVDRLALMLLDLDHQMVIPRVLAPATEPSREPARLRRHLTRPAPCSQDPLPQLPPSHPLTSTAVRTVRSWMRQRQVAHYRVGDAQDSVIPVLLGAPPAQCWLGAPLTTEHGATGALLISTHPQKRFRAPHARLVQALIEPFTAALENDRRLHELDALREAAEADKRSALSRLGREQLVDTIIGAEGGLKGVMERVALVAPSDLTVLIFGATGSGKEVIARAIHQQSPRHKGPFIRVNCGAIPPELIDSELFGHERGAFTGATATRRGWFERADEGTLLLDEIGELSPAAQVRLLRVLQEGAFERVGGEQPILVNVRIIAATHRDLPAMVQNGRFREDLWYRLSGFPIILPSLRERRQDIAPLAAHFASRAARRFGLRPQQPRTADLALLTAYDWPGNIRELASVIDRAAILGDGYDLDIATALGGPAGAGSVSSPQPETPGTRHPHQPYSASPPDAVPSTLNQAIRRHIEAALTATRGRIEGEHGAARLLDINPHTLRARMRKLGIDWNDFRVPDTPSS